MADHQSSGVGGSGGESQAPLTLTWKHIVVTANNGEKRLLKDICGMVKGRFLAIMGASGSGKTTLMNVLARRSDKGVQIEGDTYLNGHPYGNAELKRLTGYVMQDDQLNERLTVEETLQFTANLRLSPKLSAEVKQQRVDDVIKRLGLEHCRHMLVGDRHHKGIPGGERKRLCTAIELLTQPKLIFLDEPTTSLDSNAALHLCTILKDLAHSGICTVVCTIHQPQTKIFALFDDLLLLSFGRVVYHGNAAKAVDSFAAAGYPIPPYTNPADHLLDIIVKHPDVEVVSPPLEAPAGVPQSPVQPGSPDVPVSVEPLDIDWERITWMSQFGLLFHRSMLEIRRSWKLIMIQIITTVIMGILLGTAFLRIGTDQSSTVRRNPVLFFCSVNQGVFGSLLVINSFPSERVLVLRERAAGTYYVSAYLVAKSLATTLQHMVSPIVFSCVVYFLVGLQPIPGKFFLFMLYMILVTLASTSLAFAISTICRTTTFSLTVLPFVLEIFRLFGGFFLSPANLPGYFSWLDALSVNKYGYVGAALNELEGLTLTCTPAQIAAKTCIPNGETTINSLGLNKLSTGLCVMALFVMIFGYRVIAYFGLRYVKW